MNATVVLTKPPLSTSHFTEALRVSLMLSALGHRVNLVLIDEGVLILLEKSGSSFGNETLRNAEGVEGLEILIHRGSLERLLHGQDRDCGRKGYRIVDSAELARILLSTKTLVF